MPKDHFSTQDRKAITRAITDAEQNTSGEIRVHIESHCKEDVLDHAAYIFSMLNMHKTRLRNGVLFYLAFKDHKFAIIGDKGINQVVPENFWEDIKMHMRAKFKEGNYTQGLEEGIRMAGEQLKKHFPYQSDNVNELRNDISFGQ